ncbi:hypothetical protein Axi01nite_96380 [Actinoplanes xinjiangensis]|nr:hypothetical protein Axi01nite_96380 [Actinoplanes xinjiangensis]
MVPDPATTDGTAGRDVRRPPPLPEQPGDHGEPAGYKGPTVTTSDPDGPEGNRATLRAGNE